VRGMEEAGGCKVRLYLVWFGWNMIEHDRDEKISSHNDL